MPELKDLLNAIICKASKWYDIGIQLDLTVDELDNIEANGKSVEENLRNMLKKCLNNHNPPLTWRALIKALKQPALDEQRLASELEKRYVHCDDEQTSEESEGTYMYNMIQNLRLLKLP